MFKERGEKNIYFIRASEIKDSLNLKFGDMLEDDFETRCVTSEGLTQGLEGAVLQEMLFPSFPRRR